MSHRALHEGQFEQLGLWGEPTPLREVNPSPQETKTPEEPHSELWEHPIDYPMGKGDTPMFLTPREILHNFSPWQGDRYKVEARVPGDDGETTRRETDDEVWRRKAEEGHIAMYGPSLFDRLRGDGEAPSATHMREAVPLERPSMWSPSMTTDIPEGEEGSESDDRPRVLGAQHRVALLHEHDPDSPLPVVFHDAGPSAAISPTSKAQEEKMTW